MIKSIKARFFRKHEALEVSLTNGLNVIRGPNEAGKSTLLEIVMYCLGGSSCLRDTLAETVTWGRKDKELWGETVMCSGGVEYTFTRSPAGAEVNYSGLKITGQKEVTAFAAMLMGADMKTASSMMLATQSGILGALDEGPSAVSALMGKLADFDLIDTIVENAQKRLTLGSDVPLKDKLATAEAELEACPKPDPITLVDMTAGVEAMNRRIEMEKKRRAEELYPVLDKAQTAYSVARQHNEERDRLATSVELASSQVASCQTALATAAAAALVRPTPEELATSREAVRLLGQVDEEVRTHQLFLSLPAYPEVFWDTDQASFEVALDAMKADRQKIINDRTLLEGEKRGLKFITDGKCPTCGHASVDAEHVASHNDDIKKQIATLDAKMAALSTAELDGDLEAMANISSLAWKRAAALRPIPAERLAWDMSVFPPRVSWNGDVPTATDAGPARKALADLEAQERAAAIAEGQAVAHRQTLVTLQATLVELATKLGTVQPIDLAPLEAASTAAFALYTTSDEFLATLNHALGEMVAERDKLSQQNALSEQTRAGLAARIAEYQADIKKLGANNALVLKLKKVKPAITDHLWNNVLAAVSSFFSELRGEQSMVTKDADGFKVNSKSAGSLSGSTKDVLALAMRVALTKTFVPQTSLMVLDEPASGCDTSRTANMLGFLSGVGFQQVLLASHDELSCSVADNLVELGV
jgi:hypothetical protein